MLTVSSALETALLKHEAGVGSFDCMEVIEVYASDYQPHAVNGYEPDEAEKRWCGILGFTFLTLAYDREYIDRGDIQCYFGKQENNVTLNFSNISRSLAQWVQSTEIEGKQLVIRILSRGSSTTLADSLPRFVGRLDKPGDFSDTEGSLTATQRFGQINQQFPPRTFSPNDSQNRAANDPLFEGFRFSAQTASVIFTTRVRRQGFGGLVGLTKKVTHSFQASSKTDISADLAVPDAFGRVQLYGTYLATLDIGGAINFSAAVCEGAIDSYVQIKQINPKFSQISANPAKFYGYLGNEGPVGREQKPIKILNPSVPNHPGDGFYSRTAWFAGFVSGSSVDIDEAEAPDWIILIKAKIIKTPDGSGVFNIEAWSDNPAHIARYVLSDARYFNEGESAIDDPICWATGLECDEFVLDSTKGEWTFIPQADAAKHGVDFSLYRSTGLVDSRYVRMKELGTLAGDPVVQLVDVEPFDPTDPPEPFDPPTNPNLKPTVLRKRHTCNVTITEKISGLDFLYNVLAPTGRLFFRRNGKGKIQILREKPADNTRLRTAVSASATSIPITNVDPWKTGLLLTQKLLIGNTLTTSEVRVVTAANYTSDGNSITLAASGSGGVTLTPSGATLSGGSSSVPASGTVTLSGTPASGAVATVTINGLVCTYVLDSFDSLDSAAILLARYINATPKLNQFVKASRSGAVVTITAKWGVLTVTPAIANSHSAEVSSPTSVPGLTAAGGGALPAGTWLVGYSRRSSLGATAVSPVASVVLTANQKIDVTGLGGLPAGVVSIDWYVSKFAGSTELVFWANNDGSAFSIGTSTLPDSSASLPPDMNESGEELLRVAMSFSSNDQGATVLAQTGLVRGNIHKGSFKWPLPGKQSSTNMVYGTFFDATEDYAPTPLEVHDYDHQTQIRKVNKKEVDLSGFDNHAQSSQQLNFTLSKFREGDWFDSLSAGPYAMLLEEGDIYCASSDNGGMISVVTRVEELSIGPAPTFTTKIVGRKYSTRMFSDNVRQHSIRLSTTLRAITPIPSVVEFIDNFPIRDSDGLTPGFYVVVSFDRNAQGSWRGWQLWADYGDGYIKIAEGDVPAILGTATTTLGLVSNPSTWDRINSVTFTVEHGLGVNDTSPFETVTEEELTLNPRRNLFLIGNEYVQAGTIISNGNHSYTLSTLLRGRFGTTEAEFTVHTSNERVIYLNGAEKFVNIDVTRLNGVFNYKALTVNEDLGDVAATPFTWTGGNLRPLAPVNLRGTRDAQGNLLVRWTRRNRLSPGMVSGSDVPLSEQDEEYDLQVLSGDTPLWTTRITGHQNDPALLVGTTGAHLINSNSIISGTGAGNTDATAFTIQRLDHSGAWLEAELVSQGGSFASIGLLEPQFAQRFGFELPDDIFRSTVQFTTTGSPAGFAVIEDRPGVPGSSTVMFQSGSLGPITSVRIRILIEGTALKYFWDHTGPGSVPFFVSDIPAPLPLVGVCSIVASSAPAKVQNILVGSLIDPSFHYSAEKQTTDFGAIPSNVRMRVREVSAIVGPGPWADAVI